MARTRFYVFAPLHTILGLIRFDTPILPPDANTKRNNYIWKIRRKDHSNVIVKTPVEPHTVPQMHDATTFLLTISYGETRHGYGIRLWFAPLRQQPDALPEADTPLQIIGTILGDPLFVPAVVATDKEAEAILLELAKLVWGSKPEWW